MFEEAEAAPPGEAQLAAGETGEGGATTTDEQPEELKTESKGADAEVETNKEANNASPSTPPPPAAPPPPPAVKVETKPKETAIKEKADKKDKKGGDEDESEGRKSKKEKGKGKGKGKKKDEEEEEEEEAEEEEEQPQLDDDLLTWESYTVSIDVLEEVVPEVVEKPEKKKKKGEQPLEDEELKEEKPKKDKKAKKAKEPAPSESLDEIAKMKQMAALATAVPEVSEEAAEEAPTKKKKGKGKEKKEEEPLAEGEVKVPTKKLSKKEKAALAAEMAKQAEIQARIDEKNAIEAERIRVIEERKANIEKERREIIEQKLRVEQLGNSLNLFNAVKKQFIQKTLADKEEREWNRFLKCDGLPNPSDCGEMNTYLYQWNRTMENTTIEESIARTSGIIQLMDILNLLIDEPMKTTKYSVANWKMLYLLFAEHQQKSLDLASYNLLRDIQKNLTRLNLAKADFKKVDANLVFSLWVLVQMPTAMPNPRKPLPPQINLDFPEMYVHVVFPKSINCVCMAVRAMYLRYDHLSLLCATFAPPPVPEEYTEDLNVFNIEEWRLKLFYKYEAYRKNQENFPIGDSGEDEVQRLPPIDPTADFIPAVPYRKLEVTASEHMMAGEVEVCNGIREGLRTYVEDDVINLRKYAILGGTLYLDLFYQPPQPKDMVTIIMTVTRLQMPTWLEEVPFYEIYEPPLPIEDSDITIGTKEIEEELLYIQNQLEKLISVTLTLPRQILWLDAPIICQWDRRKKLWSTADIYDFQHIEEENRVTFKTGRFGCIGIAIYRFKNFPFQAWEIKPEADGTVTFQITSSLLLLEFNIKENWISLAKLQNGPSNALQELIGVYYRLPKLIRLLQEGGVDIFPAFDAFCYIEGTCEKQWQMESHLYNCMAQLSVCYNFMWSRWNHAANRRTAVMQMREFNTKKSRQVPFSTLTVTPFKALLVECTETSPEFSEVPVEGMHFYSDLMFLMKGISSMPIKSKVFNAPGPLVVTLAKLLLNTRVLSFSS